MLINQFDPELHQVIEVEPTRFLRRETGLQDLFTVLNRGPDTWSVAIWVNKDRGQFRELKILKNIFDLDRDAVDDLIAFAKRRTKSYKEIMEERRAARAEADRKWCEQNNEATACKKWLGKRLGRMLGNNVADNPEWNKPGFTIQPMG